MSTNKTENHQLHGWELGDDFLLSEINENFAAIDGGLPQNKRLWVVVGSYLGSGRSPRLIEVPFRPKAVMLACKMNNSHPINTICIDGVENNGVSIEDGGFAVDSHFNGSPTDTGSHVPGSMLNPYTYIALWWED